MLPDVLDLVGVPADEAFREILVGSLDGLGVAFQRPLSPPDDAGLSFYPYEQPSRRDAEYLASLDGR